MNTFLSHLLALTLLLVARPASAQKLQRPEPKEPYVYAENRIPDFKKNRIPDEGWVLDPTPEGWPLFSLDGSWKIHLTRVGGFLDYQALSHTYGFADIPGILEPSFSFAGWQSISVPLPLGEYTGDTGANPSKPGFIACYQRFFDVPDFTKGKEAVFLKFHGAGFRADVWVNGKYIGNHIGNTAPFDFDITDYIEPGKRASLLVKCIDTRYKLRTVAPYSSGLTAPVDLEVRNLPFADQIKLRSNPSNETVAGQFQMKGNTRTAQAEIRIEEAASGKLAGSVAFTAKKDQPNTFSVKLDNPRFWSPEDPFLYLCKIQLNGHDAGIARFGYRTMEIKADADGNEHFYLNGKRYYLRMFQFNSARLVRKSLDALPIPHDAWSLNNQGRLRENLLVLKFANVNSLRPHSTDKEMDETLLNLCDELGFIVNLDWTGSEYQRVTKKTDQEGFVSSTGGGQDHRPPMMESYLSGFREAVSAFHNHPSLCLFSFGNELYDHLLSSGSYDGIINRYRAALLEEDIQDRPTSGSAGRPAQRHNAKVDFVDDHQYIGVYYGSYESVNSYIKMTSAAIRDKFGVKLPFINSETGYVADDRIHPENYQVFGTELARDVYDKNRVLETLTKDDPVQAWARLGLNSGGVRSFYTDLPEFKRRKALLQVKRWLEMFRMNRAETDGVSLNTSPFSIAAYSDPDDWYGLSINPWPEPGKLVLIDPIYAFRDAFSPVQAFMEVENYHPLSGNSTKAPIQIINDSLDDATVDLTVQLRSPDGSAETVMVKKGVFVPQGADLRIPFNLDIPEDCPTGESVLETYLHSDGKKIAENSYSLYILSEADRRKKFPETSLALYDSAGKRFGKLAGKTTKEVLQEMGVSFTTITNFQDLSPYRVLVIGANSLDETVAKSGSRIAAWIVKGGRLVLLEQTFVGPIPWSSTDRIYQMGAGSFMEIFVKKHPIFEGIENEMAWESPVGSNRELFKNCLELNDSFLSVAAVSHYRDPESPKAIITDRKFGEGEYLISMVKATNRYGEDSTLTKYLENLMAYMLSDSISSYAIPGKNLEPSTEKIAALSAERARFVDISAAANRGFLDDAARSGWTGAGPASDLRNIPPGTEGISGLIPFQVLDPDQNQGRSCIILKGPKGKKFPKESPKIPIGQKCENLYFLQTAMYVAAESGESILDYEVTYEDGSKIMIPMRLDVDIADWWNGKDHENARVAYRDGKKVVYVSEWINPSPNKRIVDIRAISKENAIPIVLGITARVDNETPRNDRTEMEDNRK